MADPTLSIRSLKSHYRSGTDSLASEFFAPCLGAATFYRRAVGYFSSTALLTWADALPRMIDETSLKIQLIASPELPKADVETLRSLTDPAKRSAYQAMLVERILEQVGALIDDPSDPDPRAQLLAWLVANDRLEIRFAFPTHFEGPGIFHEKIGVFDFPNGDQVAFTGSANETLGGHRLNYESIDVYRSWAGESERIAIKADQFDEAWTNKAAGLEVKAASDDVIARLKARAPERFPKRKPALLPAPAPDERWRHQDDALAAFVAARAGVLEMATGTGKTRTTLKILDHLIKEGRISGAIVATDGVDLLDQWGGELDRWILDRGHSWVTLRHYDTHHESSSFALDPLESILVISREQLHKVLPRLSAKVKEQMLIAHDEVHGLGTPSLVKSLAGQHGGFGYRLGLSATPDRAYDPAGNAFVESEIGKTVYRFPLEAAIARGVLSEFDYVPLEYELTAGDRERLKAVYSRQAARAREGNPMSREEVWTELAKVYKTAEMKPDVFREHLKTDSSILEKSILFVETKEYGNSLLETIHGYTHLYRTYYAEDARSHLVEFAQGGIDCLITCHRISQGIDIQALQNVILFASARAKLETIQRIGRCLRADPSNPTKRARVIDFVRPADPNDAIENADQERCAWLQGLARIRKGDKIDA